MCYGEKHLGEEKKKPKTKIFKVIIPTYLECLLNSRAEKVHADILFTKALSSPEISESDPELWTSTENRTSQKRSEMITF